MIKPWCSITDIHRGFHSSWDTQTASRELIRLPVLLQAERKSMQPDAEWLTRLSHHSLGLDPRLPSLSPHRHTTYDWLAYENKSLINRSQWVYFCPFSTFDSHPNQVKSLPTVLDAKRHTDWHTTRVANCVSHKALLGRSILQPVWFSRNMQTIQNTHFLLYVYFQFIFNTKSISI